MAEIVFDTVALTRVRFAISPTIEMAGSVRVLGNPGGHALHMPWAVRTASLVGGLDLSTLHALQGSRSYSPDFIHPLPQGPLTSVEEGSGDDARDASGPGQDRSTGGVSRQADAAGARRIRY